MIAAEKLKALGVMTLKNEHGIAIRTVTVGEQLATVLPELIAVVEAAELVIDPSPSVLAIARYEQLGEVLAVLDAKLGDIR